MEYAICEEAYAVFLEVPNMNVGHVTSSCGVDQHMISTRDWGAIIDDAGGSFAVVISSPPIIASSARFAPR